MAAHSKRRGGLTGRLGIGRDWDEIMENESTGLSWGIRRAYGVHTAHVGRVAMIVGVAFAFPLIVSICRAEMAGYD